MARHRKLSKKEVDSALKAMHRVLKTRDIHQPIRLRFAAAEPALCWKWECEELPNGKISCQWVQVPC